MITEHVFESVSAARIRYAIKDLTDIHIVQRGSEPGPGPRVLGLSALVAALMIVPLTGPAFGAGAGLVAAVFVAGLVITARRRPAARWELVATCDGRPVVLFESADHTEFDQVCRALRRALERRSELL